jgi:hypothetical protein
MTAHLQYRLHNRGIPGATADVAGDCLPNLTFCGVRRFPQKGVGGHEKSWRAEAALQGMLFVKRLLERVQDVPRGQTFDRHQGRSVGLHG